MKLILTVVALLTTLAVVSCRPKEQPAAEQAAQAEPAQTPQMHGAAGGVHTGTVQEVLQANAYTYLRLKEQDDTVWIAVTKRDMQIGQTVSFAHALEMRDFQSKDLQRTFETIYFVSEISDGAGDATATPSTRTATSGKPTLDKLAISIEPSEGGISIGQLFANRQSYADKTVRIRGQVVKVNRAIMGKNWVHLQDGTGDAQDYDLTITTQDDATPGQVVTFEGTVVLNKDFGSGYAYDVLMEQAKKLSD